MIHTPRNEPDEAARPAAGARPTDAAAAPIAVEEAGSASGSPEVRSSGADPSEERSSAGRARVAAKWRAEDVGAHYAKDRFRDPRSRDRDWRLVARLLRHVGDGHVGLGRVLDAPTGTGRLVPQLAARATRVVGLDVSRAMLMAADAPWQAATEGGDTASGTASRAVSPARIEGSVFQLPFESRSFDLVVSCRLVHHLVSSGDRRAALAELARVARGHVVLSYWDATSWHAWRRRTRGPLRRGGRDTRVAVAARELDHDLVAAGLTPLARAYSLRFISPQTWVLAAVRSSS